MIEKILLPIVIVVLLTAFYLHRTYWRSGSSLRRFWCWGVATVVIYFSVSMSLTRDYFPDNVALLFMYLNLLCVFVIPAALFALASFIGRRMKRQRRGEWIGALLAVACAAVYLYGTYIGSEKLEVNKIDFAHKDVPRVFDGYRIVQFSDAHVGSFVGSRQEILRRAVNQINALQPDLIVFTGDLHNKRAEEIAPHRQLLSSLKAKDGVVAVLGNHDYPVYLGCSEAEKEVALTKTKQAIRQLGWQLLLNEHIVIRHGNDSIVIAGMEDDDERHLPYAGDVDKTLDGVGEGAFIVMLEHTPTSWQSKIVPQGQSQLTLSGHTHGGQMSILGWSPASLKCNEYKGLYSNGRHTLYVSKGLGGVIPFRLFCNGEITVFTLKIED